MGLWTERPVETVFRVFTRQPPRLLLYSNQYSSFSANDSSPVLQRFSWGNCQVLQFSPMRGVLMDSAATTGLNVVLIRKLLRSNSRKLSLDKRHVLSHNHCNVCLCSRQAFPSSAWISKIIIISVYFQRRMVFLQKASSSLFIKQKVSRYCCHSNINQTHAVSEFSKGITILSLHNVKS